MMRLTGAPVSTEADRVAVEQAVWAACEGWTPRQVMASVGTDWPARKEPDWHDAVMVLAMAWRRLPNSFLRVVA